MEELSLKWDEHHPAVISVFEELLAKGTLVDCTIAADGQYMKAHKVVLAACSPYFEMLFSQESEKNPIVVLKDMKFQELKHLIDFVYRGQVKLPKDQLDAFVSAAESLQIKGLSGQQKKKISERFANKTVSSREVCSSPVPRKRRRNSHTETNEDSQSEPGNESSSDSNMRENFMPTPIPLGMPSTSTASSSTGISSHSVSSQQSRSLTDTRFPSHDQSSASSEQVLPDVQTVVKTEPEDPTEPLAQVFVPEPKNEEYVDDMAMLESGAGSSDMQGGTSQENTNNYPGYDSSGDTFLMNQMADQNTSSGSDLPSGLPPAGVARDQRAPTRPYQLRSSTAAATAAAAAATATAAPAAASATVGRVLTDSQVDPLASPANQLQTQLAAHAAPYRLQQVQGPMSSCVPMHTVQSHFPRGSQPRIQHQGPGVAEPRPLLPAPAFAEELRAEMQALELPYKCQHCDLAFEEMGQLQLHRRAHTRERPFRCDSCDSSFTQKHSLVTHKRIHSVDSRYRCGACSKTFGRSGDLLIHRRLVCRAALGLSKCSA
ncbi:hypothetical protein R5R35_008764 [Gryllus longicercus]|uniref:Uncharacterized protein n=1 Tax=Gryllus longicercus TaxID=2509291 RepID=A0AAN9VQY1_9ORTH